MAHTFFIQVTAGLGQENVKFKAEHSASLIAPAPVDISLYLTDGISRHRKVEIMNAWKFLYDGIRDRNLWPFANFPAGPIYSSVPIDSVTESSRLTSADPGLVFLPNHVVIGIGNDLRNPPSKESASDATNVHEVFFRRLIDFAREHVVFITGDGINHWNDASVEVPKYDPAAIIIEFELFSEDPNERYIDFYSNSPHNFTIDWGDGTITQHIDEDVYPEHSYIEPGIYTVQITGVTPDLFSYAYYGKSTFIQNGNVTGAGKSLCSVFPLFLTDHANLVWKATDYDISGYVDLSFTFAYTTFAVPPDVSNWDLSSAQDIGSMFSDCTFHGAIDVSKWDLSSVTDVGSFFSDVEYRFGSPGFEYWPWHGLISTSFFNENAPLAKSNIHIFMNNLLSLGILAGNFDITGFYNDKDLFKQLTVDLPIRLDKLKYKP